jgi:hypothetical protein
MLSSVWAISISSKEVIANLIKFDQPLPNEPVDPELVLQQLDEIGSPASMAQAGLASSDLSRVVPCLLPWQPTG